MVMLADLGSRLVLLVLAMLVLRPVGVTLGSINTA
jgi:hypothetical protein